MNESRCECTKEVKVLEHCHSNEIAFVGNDRYFDCTSQLAYIVKCFLDTIPLE